MVIVVRVHAFTKAGQEENSERRKVDVLRELG